MVIGEDEIKTNIVKIKNMATGEEIQSNLEEVSQIMKNKKCQ